MAPHPFIALARDIGRRFRLRPATMAAGVLLALLGLAGIAAPALLSYAPYHWDPELLRFGIGSVLLFTVYGVCLVMVGAAMVVSAFHCSRDR